MFSWFAATLFCETESPTEPELTVLATQASQPTPEILQSPHPLLGLQVRAAAHGFDFSAGDSNSGPHACATGTYPLADGLS